ncbi:hypothetical protein GQ53DRAFT_876235 [Thozetella sp. PMI_491]|nr:hypothetical protein GQ53DRAFT_876235 [Thozetella sp. PMI_491]
MDATTNPEEYFPGIDFPLDPDLSSFMGIGEGCLEVNGLASDPLIADLQSLDLETDASNSPLSQGDNYQNQSFSGYFPPCGLMQEGLQFNAYDSPFDALRPLPIYSDTEGKDLADDTMEQIHGFSKNNDLMSRVTEGEEVEMIEYLSEEAQLSAHIICYEDYCQYYEISVLSSVLSSADYVTLRTRSAVVQSELVGALDPPY